MKVFLLKDIEQIGMAGEVVREKEGYARNFIIPRKLGVEITDQNEALFKAKIKTIEHRKEVIVSQTSMLGQRIADMKLTIKRKMHDDGKTYGAVSQSEIAEALKAQGVNINKSQVLIDKSIKAKGAYEVTIKLTSRLKPTLKVVVVSE
jgi:large subunit ribosomal protein L9